MCYEKAQRLLMASVIALGTVLVALGYLLGFGLLAFVVVMAAAWGLLDACPSLWILNKLGLPSCYPERGSSPAA